MDIGNPNLSSIFIDDAAEAIIVPSAEEVRFRDPDVYMNRLNEIQSAKERLQELLVSLINPYEVPTHESYYIRILAVTGFFSGWIYGGILRNTNLTQEYVRKFNAATFEGRTSARRNYTDFYMSTVAGRGIKHAFLGGLLCGTGGVLALGSITYRNRLYYPDWAIGFTALGSLSRFWSLGLRGAVGGGALGLIGGSVVYSSAKLFELVSGTSISEFRYLNQVSYLQYRQNKRKRLMRIREECDTEKMSRLG